ncbi:MAG: FtsW/RodA/SpoVE family cell cycle protein [Cyclobacteriaceae bacterium]|nr:FtsW/RodA/SpoVE family cell cycle protein [Cyclobacteriaceae bacterium]
MNTLKEWAYRNMKGDPVIWFIIILLSVLSILVVYSATGSLAYKMMEGNTEYYLMKHSALVLLSMVSIWLAHRIDYRYYSGISRLLLWISVPLLVITWKFGTNINEASRWITIPFINQAFQPSDLAKLALLVTLASMLSRRQLKISDFQNAIIPMLVWIGIICGLIALTDVSSAILLFLTCMLMLFIGRVPVKYLVMLVLIGGFSGYVALSIGQRGDTAISRINEFLDDTPSYQARQAYVAMATGGVFGKGPGQSDQRNYLPSAYSDFIYAIIIEEYGIIGGILVLLLYLALLYRGMKTAIQSDRPYAGLLAAGLSFAIVLQALVNMGVAVGLGPITGLPLPFVSMGGTSQLFMGIAVGIILSVSRGELENVGKPMNNQYKEAA